MIFGTIATIATLILIQIFSRFSSEGSHYNWQFFVVQGLLLFYTIIVKSATLGPVLYFLRISYE